MIWMPTITASIHYCTGGQSQISKSKKNKSIGYELEKKKLRHHYLQIT